MYEKSEKRTQRTSRIGRVAAAHQTCYSVVQTHNLRPLNPYRGGA
jgi:hypothetical protein